MVYDAVGKKSLLPPEEEEDVKGQQKLTESDKEVARWKLILRLGAALIWVDACSSFATSV